MTPSPVTRVFSLGAIILAAGRSARMGRPKLVLPWGETSVLGHLLQQWKSLGARQIAVVCAAGDQAVRAELDRLGFPAEERIYNPEPERGMFSSIQVAAQWPGWKRALTHWAIVLGDQPHLRHETLRQVLEFSAAHPDKVTQPVQSGHGRHPVFLPQAAFLDLATSGAADLKAFLGTMPHPAAFCELEDPGLDVDMDRPEDYPRALKLAGKGPAP